MSWEVHIDAPAQAVGRDPEALSMEIDPRNRVIRLGLRALGATSQEVDGGAVLRRYLDAATADWVPIQTWLLGNAAAPFLATIQDGYTAEQRWSGDWAAQWTEAAWDAATALHQAIEAMLQDQG